MLVGTLREDMSQAGGSITCCLVLLQALIVFMGQNNMVTQTCLQP